MATKLTTNNQRYTAVENLIETISANDSNYYFFFGNHDPTVTTPPQANATEFQESVDTYSNMIAGKRITSDDIIPAIKNIPYVSNTVYDMYDDQDEDLADKEFFAITDEGSFQHVYKCLDNNRGNESTVQPVFAHVSGSNSFIYQTSDGYRWKYMFSISSGQNLKFSTSDYFPVFPNTAVSSEAVGGAVDIIVVDGTGQRYDNYISGALSTQNIRVGGNNLIYEIANTNASLIANFYVGCLMYITNGTGAGGYSRVAMYISNNDGNYVVLANNFSVAPLNGSEYEIYPEAKVYGTGVNLVNCVCRALVNSLASNSIYRVETLARGSGYDVVYSANVAAHASVGITLPAELRPIQSPPRGHGFDAGKELFSNSALLSVKFSNTENNTIPATNSFKQIGIIRDPIFANVSIEFENNIGTFSVGETAYCIKTTQLCVDATVNTTSNVVTSATANFIDQLSLDPYVFLKSADSDAYQLATIDTITDASNLILTTNGFFACTTTTMYKVTFAANAIVTSANNTDVLLANVSGYFTTGSQIIGSMSGAYTQANLISISDVAKGFDTFVEAYKYVGTPVSGAFVPNEYLVQANIVTGVTASALLHSQVSNNTTLTIYTTQQKDNFSVGGTNTIIGNTSGAELQITETYPPELVFRTGDVLYYENVSEITRSNVTSEVFQVSISY